MSDVTESVCRATYLRTVADGAEAEGECGWHRVLSRHRLLAGNEIRHLRGGRGLHTWNDVGIHGEREGRRGHEDAARDADRPRHRRTRPG